MDETAWNFGAIQKAAMRTVDSDHGRIDSPVELSLHSIMGAIEKKWPKVIIPSTSCAHLRGKLELTLSSARKRHAKPYWMRIARPSAQQDSQTGCCAERRSGEILRRQPGAA